MAEEYSEPVKQIDRGRKRRVAVKVTSARYSEESAGPLDISCGHTTREYISVRGPKGCYAADLLTLHFQYLLLFFQEYHVIVLLALHGTTHAGGKIQKRIEVDLE